MITRTYTCVECGNQFEATQPAKYCSQACKVRHINHAKALFQCVYCGAEFEGCRNQKPKFCSQKCVSACRSEILKNPDSPLSKYMKVTPCKKQTYDRICTVCGKSFTTYSPTTVNRNCPDCAKSYGARWYAKQIEWNKTALKLSKAELDKAIEAQHIAVCVGDSQPAKHDAQSPVRQKNQTREETNARRRLLYAKKRALGLLQVATVPKTRNRLAYISASGSRCSICGFDADVDALQIHHIDLNRQNNTDSNICVICANCHTIVHQRIKRNWYSYGEDKTTGIKTELAQLKAEVKSRNEAGTADRQTRTEGCGEPQSGATHIDRSRTDISRHEAATAEQAEKIC